MTDTRLLRPMEAAERLGVTTATVSRLEREGVLACLRIGNGARRYHATEIELLADNRHLQRLNRRLEDDLTTALRTIDALRDVLDGTAHVRHLDPARSAS